VLRRLAIVAVVLATPYGLWRVERPELAERGRQGVRDAERDPMWRYVPGRFREVRSSSHVTDAEWVPKFESSDFTGVSVYRRTLSAPIRSSDDVRDWMSAAALGGWTYEGCAPSGPGTSVAPGLLFSKEEDVRFLWIRSGAETTDVEVDIPSGTPYRTAAMQLPPSPCLPEDVEAWREASGEGR
jgi:hypothetical protein